MRLAQAAFLVSACLICLSASRCASPASPAGGGTVSILAYNVKSLFDAIDDGSEFPEFSVAKGKWDEARYKIRLANVAAAVLASAPQGDSPPGPDLLCLEEIENEAVLEALRTGPLSAARYRYAAIAPAEGGPFSVCALSRLPILASSCHYAATPAGRAGRDLLELELDIGGRRLIVLLCHWKSKSEGAEVTEEARRESAALVRGLVAARIGADPAAEIVVCGDLNESPDEYLRTGKRYATALMGVEELEVFAGASSGAVGPPPLSARPARLLVASSAARAVPYDGECVLYSPWAESDGYSYSFRGSRDRIDNFLLSPGLLDSAGLSYRGFSVAKADFLVDAEGNPVAWPGSGSSGYSDHLPILLVLGIEAGSP
jgi:endonuclease/exonuclease/phosphatase family metal-dependent hydrolase